MLNGADADVVDKLEIWWTERLFLGVAIKKSSELAGYLAMRIFIHTRKFTWGCSVTRLGACILILWKGTTVSRTRRVNIDNHRTRAIRHTLEFSERFWQ